MLDDDTLNELIHGSGVLGEDELVASRQLFKEGLDVIGPDFGIANLRNNRGVCCREHHGEDDKGD